MHKLVRILLQRHLLFSQLKSFVGKHVFDRATIDSYFPLKILYYEYYNGTQNATEMLN